MLFSSLSGFLFLRSSLLQYVSEIKILWPSYVGRIFKKKQTKKTTHELTVNENKKEKGK